MGWISENIETKKGGIPKIPMVKLEGLIFETLARAKLVKMTQFVLFNWIDSISLIVLILG